MRGRARLCRRHRNQRGASLVEFAMVLPVLILLVFGIIDFGTTYNDYLSVRSGTRDGARQAVVGNFGSNGSCTLTNPTGSSETAKLMCLTKDRIGLSQTDVRVKVLLGANGYAKGEPIVVCAVRKAESVTGLFSVFLSGKTLKTKVQMRIETLKSGVTTPLVPGLDLPGQEDPPTGTDWSFCSVTPT